MWCGNYEWWWSLEYVWKKGSVFSKERKPSGEICFLTFVVTQHLIKQGRIVVGAWESCSAIIISYPFKEDRFVATSYRFCILLCHSSWLNGNPHQAFTNLVWFWRGAFERRLNGFAFLFCQGHRSLVTYSEQSKLFLCW